MAMSDLIAARAAEILGRPLKAPFECSNGTWITEPCCLDFAACEAVQAAAREITGISGHLLQWVPTLQPNRGARTQPALRWGLIDLARAWLIRAVVAYGPIDGLIDAGSHMGRAPLVVRP